jgi:hypothetical protein
MPEQQQRDCVSKLGHRDWLLNERFGPPEHRTRLKELVLVAGAVEHLGVHAAPCRAVSPVLLTALTSAPSSTHSLAASSAFASVDRLMPGR